VADFERVQAVLAERKLFKTPLRRNENRYCLTGLLKCAHCGGPLVGVRRSNHKLGVHYLSYVCGNYQQSGNAVCKKHIVRENIMVPILARKLQRGHHGRTADAAGKLERGRSCPTAVGVRPAGIQGGIVVRVPQGEARNAGASLCSPWSDPSAAGSANRQATFARYHSGVRLFSQERTVLDDARHGLARPPRPLSSDEVLRGAAHQSSEKKGSNRQSWADNSSSHVFLSPSSAGSHDLVSLSEQNLAFLANPGKTASRA
jgi:hypothetical protein